MFRFALYYAPRPETALAEAASSWLGRDHENRTCSRITSKTLGGERFAELTKAPFHYGFHGTLKPPFRLHDATSKNLLCEEIDRFCNQRSPFIMKELEIGWIGNFLCLRPVKSSDKMNKLARDAVRQFDNFREDMSFIELEKRRNQGLTPQQDALLLQWGYPYVMDEFRFHLTLSSKIEDSQERTLLEEEARRHFSSDLLQEIPVDGISLFVETDGQPMTLLRFFPFKE